MKEFKSKDLKKKVWKGLKIVRKIFARYFGEVQGKIFFPWGFPKCKEFNGNSMEIPWKNHGNSHYSMGKERKVSVFHGNSMEIPVFSIKISIFRGNFP